MTGTDAGGASDVRKGTARWRRTTGCMMSGAVGNATGIATVDAALVARTAGQVLREVRQSRSLSLRQVTVRSRGEFKPSSLASYERGERMISLERLLALAEVYAVPPESIVASISGRLAGGAGASASGPGSDVPRGVGLESRSFESVGR